MSTTRLRLKNQPALRVDARAIVPAAFAGLTVAQAGKLALIHGNQTLALAELFNITITDSPDDELIFDGDLSRFDRVGWLLASGRIVVNGSVGDHAGGGMSAGELHVKGSAGALAAAEMSGGRFTVDANVGDFAASAWPGSMNGMRGGTLVVKGNAGERFGDRMRRGSALVFGHAGDFLASRLVAGTIAIGGTAGSHIGLGMRRGSVIFAGPAPRFPSTFVPALVEVDVIWQLLARDIAQHGGPFAGLAKRRLDRHLGDLAAAGKGELMHAV